MVPPGLVNVGKCRQIYRSGIRPKFPWNRRSVFSSKITRNFPTNLFLEMENWAWPWGEQTLFKMTMSSLLSLFKFSVKLMKCGVFFREIEHGTCVFQKLSMLAARLGKWSRKIQSCSFPSVEKSSWLFSWKRWVWIFPRSVLQFRCAIVST